MRIGNHTLATGLGFVAGYVDTLGFVALFGLFTAHVTGNFVLIGAVWTSAEGSVLPKLLVFPAFIAAVACTRLLVLRLQRTGQAPLRPLLLVQAALLGGFAVCGSAALPISDPESNWVLAAGALGAMAMGIQNATARLVLGTLTPTTVMTGNVTQLVIDAVDLLRGAGDAQVRERSRRLAGPIAAFAAGAVAGAFGYRLQLFAALWLPTALLVIAACAPPRAPGA